MVYSKYAGTEVALDKTDYVLLKVSMQPAATLLLSALDHATRPSRLTACRCWRWQEEDVIGVMPSPSVRELLPLGDRILIEVSGSG